MRNAECGMRNDEPGDKRVYIARTENNPGFRIDERTTGKTGNGWQVVADLAGSHKRLGRVAWTACEEESDARYDARYAETI